MLAFLGRRNKQLLNRGSPKIFRFLGEMELYSKKRGFFLEKGVKIKDPAKI
jgi:hypothetical protein